MQGNRMSDGTSLPIGGNHVHMMDSGQTVVHRPQSPGMDAVCQLSTGEVILEATRFVQDPELVRKVLGDTDRKLALSTDPMLRSQRITLTPTDGFVMSRVDGTLSADPRDLLAARGELRVGGLRFDIVAEEGGAERDVVERFGAQGDVRLSIERGTEPRAAWWRTTLAPAIASAQVCGEATSP